MTTRQQALNNLEKAWKKQRSPEEQAALVERNRRAGQASAAKRKAMKEKIEAIEKALGKPIIEI